MSFTISLLKYLSFVPNQGQQELIRKLEAFTFDRHGKPVFVLRGYAGTGKTSIVSAMVSALRAIGKKSVLLAPTGRAAKVISAYSHKQAFTIHKRIYFQKYRRDGTLALTLQQNLHKDTVIIVDEASMIAAEASYGENLFSSRNLLDDLIQYVYEGERCSLVLIGDTAQLPPVGLVISPALDLKYLRSRYDLSIHAFELQEVMRQSLESGILANATGIRRQIKEEVINYPLFDLSDRHDVLRISGMDLEETLNTAYAEGAHEDTIIVTRSNKRANIFNQEVRRRILFREEEIEAGDYMMVVKNNYFWLPEESRAGFIANGDIIELLRVGNIEELHGFRFTDASIRLIDYADEPILDVKLLLDTVSAETPALTSPQNKKLFEAVMDDYDDIPERSRRFQKVRTDPFYNALQVKFAYAMTCHKTQGGQWKHVFIDQGYLKKDMVDVEYLRWLYTACTRATEKLYLVNFNESFF
jgi:exodeoxyribonuclease-5